MHARVVVAGADGFRRGDVETGRAGALSRAERMGGEAGEDGKTEGSRNSTETPLVHVSWKLCLTREVSGARSSGGSARGLVRFAICDSFIATCQWPRFSAGPRISNLHSGLVLPSHVCCYAYSSHAPHHHRRRDQAGPRCCCSRTGRRRPRPACPSLP